MRTILVAIVLAAVSASAIDLKCVKIKSPEDIDAIAAIPEWRRGADTNGITISVCVGMASYGPFTDYPLSRELTFDAEGRLVKISRVALIPQANTGHVKSLGELKTALFSKERLSQEQRDALNSIQEELRKKREQQQASESLPSKSESNILRANP